MIEDYFCILHFRATCNLNGYCGYIQNGTRTEGLLNHTEYSVATTLTHFNFRLVLLLTFSELISNNVAFDESRLKTNLCGLFVNFEASNDVMSVAEQSWNI